MQGFQWLMKEGIFHPGSRIFNSILNNNSVMTWTRLFYLKSMEKAFKRVIPGKEMKELNITKRY